MTLTPDEIQQQQSSAAKEGYVYRALVSADQFINVLTGGLPGETISSRSQRAANRGSWLGIAMTKFLHLFEKDHGEKALAGDLQRAETVETIEKKELGIKETKP